jgi:hypothetical protein
MTTTSNTSGQIVRTVKDGLPILWSYVPEMPSEIERSLTPWLAVVSWAYDGSGNNGMPDSEGNAGMQKLDGVLRQIERPTFCFEAYRRVGNGLREFVFYIADRDQFMAELNEHLASHPRFPLEIKFYKDEPWSDFQRLIDDFADLPRPA